MLEPGELISNENCVQRLDAEITNIHVVVPVYQSYGFLNRLFTSLNVASVVGGVYWRLIFIDDSPEASFDWQALIHKFETENEVFDEIQYFVNRKNRGVTYSRNFAYSKCASGFCVFFDSDDEALPNTLDNIAREVLSLDPRYNVLLMATNASTMQQKAISTLDYFGLILDYGKGERLVIVRVVKNLKPFFGALRGSELAGLISFLVNSQAGVTCSQVVVRRYMSDNNFSISSGDGFIARLPLIMKGNCWVSKQLYLDGHFLWSARFALSLIKHSVTLLRAKLGFGHSL
jgi:glycosyltransferase involved in cell wall biosynthesis